MAIRSRNPIRARPGHSNICSLSIARPCRQFVSVRSPL
jgi:hypothetical protein